MSPMAAVFLCGTAGVPRASGDEPIKVYGGGVSETCSPRERG